MGDFKDIQDAAGFIRKYINEPCELSVVYDGEKYHVNIKGEAPAVFAALVELVKAAAVADKNIDDPVNYAEAVCDLVKMELSEREVAGNA